jgi:MFS family permease
MIVWVVSQGFFLFGFDSTSLVDLQIYIIESYPDMTMFQR